MASGAPMLSLRLPADEIDAITDVAAQMGTTRSELVREALRRLLAEERPQGRPAA